MGKIVIHIKQHTYPRDKDIEQLIAYISGHGKHHKQKVYYRNCLWCQYQLPKGSTSDDTGTKVL